MELLSQVATLIVSVAVLILVIIDITTHSKMGRTLNDEDNKIDIGYSRKVIRIIRDISIQASVDSFQEFADGHELNKVTKAQIQNLITTTAEYIKSSIDFDSIDFNRTIYKRTYLESYIVNTVVKSLKDLLNKAVDENY